MHIKLGTNTNNATNNDTNPAQSRRLPKTQQRHCLVAPTQRTLQTFRCAFGPEAQSELRPCMSNRHSANKMQTVHSSLFDLVRHADEGANANKSESTQLKYAHGFPIYAYAMSGKSKRLFQSTTCRSGQSLHASRPRNHSIKSTSVATSTSSETLLVTASSNPFHHLKRDSPFGLFVQRFVLRNSD